MLGQIQWNPFHIPGFWRDILSLDFLQDLRSLQPDPRPFFTSNIRKVQRGIERVSVLSCLAYPT